MRSFRRTLTFLAPYRWRVLSAVILTLLVTLLQLAPPRILHLAIDYGVKSEGAMVRQEKSKRPIEILRTKGERSQPAKQQVDQRVRSLLLFSILLAASVMLRSMFNYMLHYRLSWIGHRFCFDLRFATWRHLHRLSLAYHNQTQTGKIMARVTGDIELIQTLIQGQLVTFISDSVTLVAVLGMLFFIEWRLATIILFLVPFYVISYMAMLKHIRAVSQEQRRLWDEMLGKLSEKIAGIAVVKAFVREAYETENFMSSVREKFRVDMVQVKLNRTLSLVSGLISALGTGAVYSYGGHLVRQNEMSVGALVAVTFYITYVFNPAVRVIDFNNALQWAVAAMDRVFQTLDTRPEIIDRPDAVSIGPLVDKLIFHNVSFSYPESGQVLKRIDLTVDAGELIAIVGHSGAGKSTLMNLLMRFYDPTEGWISFDGADLKNVRLESLRRQMSMVSQENVLFSVSIMENVKYGAKNVTDEQAIEACKVADLHDFVMELEDGYETKIGEEGMKLSGGQKQRLALARALVTNPSVLILDDVTSALDGETEARVQESLKAVMRGRTTFIIAHRLSSVVDADRIVVLEDGQLSDIGTHEQLISRPGIYLDIYKEQFKSVLERSLL